MIYLVVFLEEVQYVHSRNRMKVVGAINYIIKNIVYERYHWVIYEMFFRDELKPNFISQSTVTPLGFVTHAYLSVSLTL